MNIAKAVQVVYYFEIFSQNKHVALKNSISLSYSHLTCMHCCSSKSCDWLVSWTTRVAEQVTKKQLAGMPRATTYMPFYSVHKPQVVTMISKPSQLEKSLGAPRTPYKIVFTLMYKLIVIILLTKVEMSSYEQNEDNPTSCSKNT